MYSPNKRSFGFLMPLGWFRRRELERGGGWGESRWGASTVNLGSYGLNRADSFNLVVLFHITR